MKNPVIQTIKFIAVVVILWLLTLTVVNAQTVVLPPNYLVGDVIYASGTKTLSKLGLGTSGTCLKAGSTAPEYVGCLTGFDTDDLLEGSTNQYFTNARAVSALTGQNISIFTNNSGFITDVTGDDLDDLSNVTITSNTNGEILKWNGTAWVNNLLSEAGISATGHGHTASDVSDFDTEVANNSDVTANTAKVTNATHTGEVDGATTLTLNIKAIENRTDTAVAPADYFLFLDATDSALKKDTIQGILDLVSGGSGDVSKVGTPVDNQVGVWTGDGTIEGTSGLVFSSNALGIGGVGNVGAYSGSVATVRGSNSNIFEMIRDTSTSDTLLGRFVAGNTSNSVSSSIDFRSGTVNNRGQIRLMTSNGTTNTEALRIDEAQKATFYNGGVNLDYSTASRVPVLDASKNLIASSITDTELGYVSGVTSAIQTQLDAKLTGTFADVSTTNTGTSTTTAVTPDALAGSNLATIPLQSYIFDVNYLITTGDGKVYTRIPSQYNGMDIVAVACEVDTTSSSGTPTFQLARGRRASATSTPTYVDVLSTRVTIDVSEYDSKDATTPAVINTSNDDVATGDYLRWDSDVTGTGTKGLNCSASLRLP